MEDAHVSGCAPSRAAREIWDSFSLQSAETKSPLCTASPEPAAQPLPDCGDYLGNLIYHRNKKEDRMGLG